MGGQSHASGRCEKCERRRGEGRGGSSADSARHRNDQKATDKGAKARQYDRQREEIHPSSVFETLENLAPTVRESLHLAEAIPDPEKVFSREPLVVNALRSEQVLP